MLRGIRFGHVRRALGALAAGGFVIGMSEFLILGLLPQVAADLDVSIPQAGRLISAYALGVVVGAPVLTALSVSLPRKKVLLGLMSWYAVSNVLTALAPTFPLVLLGRFASGLPHGAFFGVGSVVAGGLAPQARRTLAMSIMFAGLTTATIVGVPLSTLIGQNTSWRLMYVVIGVLAAAAVVLIAVAVPDEGRPEGANMLRAELRSFADHRIWLMLLIAILGDAGLFATFSYISPMMTEKAGYAESSLTWLLVLFGVGMTAGNLIGARLTDRYATTTLVVALSVELVLAVLFALTTSSKPWAAVLIVLFPTAAMAAVPALQGGIISLAAGAPNIAAASMQAAFNIANSLGAYVGGVVIAAGYGYSAPNWVAAGFVVPGLALSFVLIRTMRRRTVVDAPALPV
jgi:DHA1 family inner membrane transport protein